MVVHRNDDGTQCVEEFADCIRVAATVMRNGGIVKRFGDFVEITAANGCWIYETTAFDWLLDEHICELRYTDEDGRWRIEAEGVAVTGEFLADPIMFRHFLASAINRRRIRTGAE
jgi:hypothetical protein